MKFSCSFDTIYFDTQSEKDLATLIKPLSGGNCVTNKSWIYYFFPSFWYVFNLITGVCLREDDLEEWGIMNNISPKLTKSNQDPNKKSPLVEENNIIKDVSLLDVQFDCNLTMIVSLQ